MIVLPPDDRLSILRVVSTLLRHRYWILGSAAALALAAALATWIQPRTYTAGASFMEQEGEGGRSGLAAVAGQFGLDIPLGDPTASPQFYADLLTSRAVLSSLADGRYEVVQGERTVARSLPEILEIQEETKGEETLAVVSWLRDESVSVSTNRNTGVVTLWVTSPRPELSHQIAERLVREVNEFNLARRQSKAAAERAFIQERLDEVRDTLGQAEGRLKAFLEQNRQFQNSPELRVEYERLTSQLAMREQLYISLAQAYDQARISEVRNTPVITVIDPPEMPVRPDSKRFVLKIMLALVLGAGVGAAAGLLDGYIQRARREEADEFADLTAAWEELVQDARVGRRS